MNFPRIPRRIILLTFAIFFADASHSTIIPIFPGYARQLGASLIMLGTYGSAAAITMLIFSIPLGRLSDKHGRKRMMTLGLILFIIVPLCYILAKDPIHLYPIRIILGIGVGTIFGNGFLLISEISNPKNRNKAQGFYMTSMGLGFTLGPLLGGYTTKIWGIKTSFFLSSLFAIISFILILLVEEEQMPEIRERELRDTRSIIKKPSVQASGIANFLNALMFNAITLFYPVYSADVGLDEAQIGLGFTTRGIVSTLVRLPVGIVIKYLSTFTLMVFGLTLSAMTILTISVQTSLIILSMVMGIQGFAYGIYLTSGNVYITEESPPSQRGTSMAIYSMFGNLGGILGPLVLGLIAENSNSSIVLTFSAIITLLGLVVVYFINRKATASDSLIPQML
jgi:MFS family permease